MAGAVFGYIVSMAAALSVLLVLLNSVLAPSSVQQAQEPLHTFAMTPGATPEGARTAAAAPPQLSSTAAASDVAPPQNRAQAPKPSVAQAEAAKRKRLRLARERLQKAIARRQERNYATAKYAQEPWLGSSFSGPQNE